ncbi:MAG: putative baseplate assembly protein [Verrucomicrobiota bacterium]|jgi:hypothetical protein
MNNPLDPSVRGLDDCGCGSGVSAATPRDTSNPPGQPAIQFRAGTHGTFRATALAALTDARRPMLAGLRTREDGDLSIALLDSWAVVGDILTFHAERTANESYLRTARERFSVLELARQIGHQTAPGVAAAATLAFQVEDAPGSPRRAILPAGLPVQSLPGPGEKPWIFETTEALTDARAEWNRIAVPAESRAAQSTRPSELWLAGTSTGLRNGDWLLLTWSTDPPPSTAWTLRQVAGIRLLSDADAGRSRTLVSISKELPEAATKPDAEPLLRVFALRTRASLFAHNAPDFRTMSAEVQGHYTVGGVAPPQQPDWPGMTATALSGSADRLVLDRVHPALTGGSRVVLRSPGGDSLARITTTEEVSIGAFGLSGNVTRLTLDPTGLGTAHNTLIRSTVLLGEEVELARAGVPIPDPVLGDRLLVAPSIPSLDPGRLVVVSGPAARLRVLATGLQFVPDAGTSESAAPGSVFTAVAPVPDPVVPGVQSWRVQHADGRLGKVDATASAWAWEEAPAQAPLVVEVVRVKRCTRTPQALEIEWSHRLQGAFDRRQTVLLANAVGATHGESAREVLGHGDAARPHQSFTLRNDPLTYTAASNPEGVASRLELWVDGVRWREVPHFLASGPHDPVYVVRRADDGKVTVRFGDGIQGSRLPTGRENVVARYRHGIGSDARAAVNQLSLPLARPLGLKSVANPQAAVPGVDPESRDDIRRNAPYRVRTLDRAVSLRDYEDFAANFAGIARAHAAWTWNGRTRGVLLSVAGAGGAVLDINSATLAALRETFTRAANPLVPVRILAYRPVRFRISGTVLCSAGRDPDRVASEARERLRQRFSFDAREFGQGVPRSRVIAVLQGTPGVEAVDLDAFFRSDAASATLASYLPATVPRDGVSSVGALAAELITLDPAPDTLVFRLP